MNAIFLPLYPVVMKAKSETVNLGIMYLEFLIVMIPLKVSFAIVSFIMVPIAYIKVSINKILHLKRKNGSRSKRERAKDLF